jgi:hypothetical protein
MLISEMIKQLERIQAENGDLFVSAHDEVGSEQTVTKEDLLVISQRDQDGIRAAHTLFIDA